MYKYNFPDNYFFRQYWNLIKKAGEKDFKDDYTENHHIYPVSIFGPNDYTIKVNLKYHILLHYLIYRGFSVAQHAAEFSTMYAVRRMLGNSNNPHHGTIFPREASLAYKAIALIKWSDSSRKAVSNTMKEKWQDPDYREMQIKSHTGKKQSRATVEKRQRSIKKRTEAEKARTSKLLSEASLRRKNIGFEVLNKNTGEVYRSIAEAKRSLGVCSSTVRNIIKGTSRLHKDIELEVISKYGRTEA